MKAKTKISKRPRPGFVKKDEETDSSKNPVKKPVYRGRNKIEWRTADVVMSKLVASLPFGNAAGLKYKIDANATNGATTLHPEAPEVRTYTQPGILVVNTLLTMGCDPADVYSAYNAPVNMVARKLYSWIRHANSGSRNYENADLMLYCLSIMQVLGLLGWLQRLKRLAMEYSTLNRYTPKALFDAMCVDIVDVQDHLPQLDYLIAWLGRAIGSLAFPDLPIFHAAYEAYKYVVRDSDSPKEQLYLLSSGGFAKYNPAYSDAGGAVVYDYDTWKSYPADGELMNFEFLRTYARDMINVLLSDEDIGIISGDILKCYGKESKLYKIEAFSPDYDVFVKDMELLQQIHNAAVVPPSVAKLVCYEQRVGGTNEGPYLLASTGRNQVFSMKVGIGHQFVIDAFSAEPDAAEVINCSVLNPQIELVKNTPANNYGVGVIHCDMHLPVGMHLISGLNADSDIVDISEHFTRIGTTFGQNTLNLQLLKLTNFDWHPLIFKSNTEEIVAVGDTQNFRIFTGVVGARIHDNSILSLLGFQGHDFY